MADDKYLVVAAIDFGTTFSGYAFSMTSDKHVIMMNKSWGAAAGFQSYKTPTAVLLGPDGSCHSFGFEAEQDFLDLDEGDRDGYQLFQRFKMELFHHQDLDTNTTIKSSAGEPKPALDVITAVLAFMRRHCIDSLSQSLGSAVEEQYIRWVVTVPAIWSDKAKKFMRLAAAKAGLVGDMLSRNLIIALEPEAASIYCRNLPLEQFSGKDNTGKLQIETGEIYMIVDCGGGTIDITVHERMADGTVRDVKEASGGPWGGIYVDEKYHQLLDDIFGSHFMQAIKKEQPSLWLAMMMEFENKKRSAKTGGTVSILLSMELAEEFKNHTGETMKNRIDAKRHLGIKYSHGFLRISSETFSNMFSEVCSQIKKQIESLLSDLGDRTVSKMFVVGGFAESAHLQESLKSEFGSKMQILIPYEAGMCVMKGSVLFGHDTTAIASRIARYNFSIRSRRLFDPDFDDPSRKSTVDGVDKVVYLRSFVRKGQRIKTDEVVKSSRSISDPSTSEFTLKLYCSSTDTDDPDHPSSRLIETITVNTPNVHNRKRKIQVLMVFGASDIIFSAVDVDSGSQAYTSVELS